MLSRLHISVSKGVTLAICSSILSVSGIVITIAIAAVIYAIIDCLKRTGRAIPTYTQLATSDKTEIKSSSHSSNDIAIAIPNEFPANIPVSQIVEFPTMEKFLSNMAREKPIRFSPDQLASFTDEYKTILGSGGFGIVFMGIFPNGVQVAVKVLNNNLDKQLDQQFMAEVGTIGRTYHFNLVRLYGFCFSSNLKALVYEYMENGSLDRFLFNRTREIEWEKLHDIAVGTAKGLAYLHEECQQRITHYDIKPGNVLLDMDMNPKVADFGLAKLYNRENSHVNLTDRRGTPGYAAPEIWKPFPVTHKCDIYSFGMLLFEVVGRRRNFDDNLSESHQWLPRWTWDMFDNGELEEMVSVCGIEVKHREKANRMLMVALWCIQYSPDVRPMMSTVVKMLEGDMEVPPPPYPFEHLDSPLNLTLQSGSDDDSNTSAWLSKEASKQHSCNIPSNGALEIELVA